jgi:CRP/FNR family transcriptional regulator
MTPTGILISQTFTNNDLAELIGTTRETVNRMLSTLKKDGVISLDGEGKLKIKKLNDLKEACSCEDCPIEICRI